MGKLIKFNPAQILSIGFLSLIFIGALLLMLPISTNDGHELSFLDAIFEATSAVCVTGLVVVDTGTTFTIFGQCVLLFLIQTGGLGFMTVGVVIAIFLGKNIGLKGRLMIQESLNQLSLEGMVRLVKFILLFTLLFEAIGALFLSIRWSVDLGFPTSIYYGIFHSISAFNNAGFDIMGDYRSITSYAGDFIVVFILTSLLLIGGLGYTVILDIWRKKFTGKLTLHTKLVLWISAILIVFPTILIFVLEFKNPGTLGSLSLKDKVLGAYFHAVVPRTAGFNSLNMSELSLSTQFVTMVLMFIGGGSGGTAGGIKVTTFLIILLAIWNLIRGNDDINIMERRISKDLVYRSFAITVYSIGIVSIISFILTITEDAPLNVILFEVISAFATVGMSLGLTPDLSPVGKIAISLLMFIGRVGPLTIAFALAKKQNKLPYKYAEEKIMIG
ncbi:TrkH family potassium uptake protein [Niallia sp. Man26]|uniref:TrkH family potassium uptake protein n=1 Tax=Niallia sp. Man26 TaxID=2912824 RepID=UPI001EDB3504|nr:TrkH family potassium uptake protein [Niallia sp. Man26]UPO91157.1 TrkH family potassium uptake protein [Niallia sp. Man26]